MTPHTGNGCMTLLTLSKNTLLSVSVIDNTEIFFRMVVITPITRCICTTVALYLIAVYWCSIKTTSTRKILFARLRKRMSPLILLMIWLRKFLKMMHSNCPSIQTVNMKIVLNHQA
jgi:hypothetical protein